MNPLPFQSPPPWFPILPSEPPNSTSFWDNRNVCDRLRELQNTLNLAKAITGFALWFHYHEEVVTVDEVHGRRNSVCWRQRKLCQGGRRYRITTVAFYGRGAAKELEMLMMIKDGKGSSEDLKHASNEPCLSGFVKCLEDKRVSVESQESLAVEAANSLTSKLRAQLEPFRCCLRDNFAWLLSLLRNSRSMSNLNKGIAKLMNESLGSMPRKLLIASFGFKSELLERHSVHDIKSGANCHYVFFTVLCVLKMKAIAKSKAKEEEKKVEAGLELLLVVEKLQELRFIRIQKLKKKVIFSQRRMTSFLRKFKLLWKKRSVKLWLQLKQMLLKMQLQFATAEESRKAIQNQGKLSKGGNDDSEVKESKEQIVHSVTEEGSGAVDEKKSSKIGQISGGAMILWQIYPLSSTIIIMEATMIWAHLLRLEEDGMPISDQEEGHWVQPPPPANEIWASYLVRPK
ncbi:hypothetical protein JHK87_030717 [Glycine soja]|nr:hypothetical protein JHK87_030717 [Glycine soja]